MADALMARAREAGFNLRRIDARAVGIALDETVTRGDLETLAGLLGGRVSDAAPSIPAELLRNTPCLTHPVFREHRAEHEMLRYLKRLEDKDVALNRSMIPLGSCTMKLNASAEMIPVTFPGFADMHPFAPAEQTRGYDEIILRLSAWLREITGFAAVSLQPNAGSQGEYAGLLAIRAYHRARGDRAARCVPDSLVGARHQSGERGDGGAARGGGGLRSRGQRGSGRSAQEDRRASRTAWRR